MPVNNPPTVPPTMPPINPTGSLPSTKSSGEVQQSIKPVKPIAKRAVLIASGGLDSATLLYRLCRDGFEVFALTYDYGQRHAKEIQYAAEMCRRLHVPQIVVPLAGLTQAGLFGDSSLTSDQEIPEGDYDDATMQSTVVPNRNMIMLSAALAYAISIRAEAVYYGAHAGDHAIYPDCRPEFVAAIQGIAQICHYWPIDVRVPFLHWSKAQIVAEGLRLGVDYGQTWTCYKGGDLACGKCGSCDERLKAFLANEAVDPLPYAPKR